MLYSSLSGVISVCSEKSYIRKLCSWREKKKAAYPAVISSPTAAHNGQKGYAPHARFYGSRFELSIRSEAREETAIGRKERVNDFETPAERIYCSKVALSVRTCGLFSGGLIQTSAAGSSGRGAPRTNLSGCWACAAASTLARARRAAVASPAWTTAWVRSPMPQWQCSSLYQRKNLWQKSRP